jgi:hypothetical protein
MRPTRLYRALMSICTALLVADLSSAQAPLPCAIFNNNTLYGWTLVNASASTSIGPFADVHDHPGPSFFVAPATYHGDWLILTANCGELCFDINILDDALTSHAPVSVAFSISDNAGHGATFSHTPVVEGSGWHTFCAPIQPLANGNLPNNGQGTWALNSGTTTMNWQTLLQHVQTLRFSVDFAGSGGNDEHFQIDNICLQPTVPVPVITGPPVSCQIPATYCVATPTSGAIYSWSITPATAGTVTTATGLCTSVNWSSVSGGVIVVTASKQGCSSQANLTVFGCNPHNACCSACPQPLNVVSSSMPFANGSYVLQPVLTTSSAVKRVEIDIISASISFGAPNCGSPGSFAPTITSIGPVSGLTGSQPIPSSTEATWWTNSPVILSSATFPMTVTLPAPVCLDTIHFCLKYTVTDADCRTCEIIECYDFVRGEPVVPPGTPKANVQSRPNSINEDTLLLSSIIAAASNTDASPSRFKSSDRRTSPPPYRGVQSYR